jgi:hypothetical protein
MGEKDRMRGFGRWSFILNLPNPLTPTLSPLERELSAPAFADFHVKHFRSRGAS